MVCLEEIDCGSSQAQAELLFLAELLLQLGDSIDPATDITGAFGFSDIYRSPACETYDFIRLNKVSVSLVKDLAALRIRALKGVRDLVEIVNGHRVSPIEPKCASSSALEVCDFSDATASSHSRVVA
jgi:hypothetical protein